jgi:predicted translin family RNA/ssDNA-binding protein
MQFMQSQIEAAERLYKLMADDHRERMNNLSLWVDMNASLQRKLQQRDAEISDLRAKLRDIETADRL